MTKDVTINSATVWHPQVYQRFVEERWFGSEQEKVDPALFIAGTGFAGETGEVMELLKKYIRDGYIDTIALEKELGDALYYLTKIASLFNLTLEGIMQTNYKKLIDRDARGVTRGSGNDR